MKSKKESVQTAVVLASLQTKAKPLFNQLAKSKVRDLSSYDATAFRVKQLKELSKLGKKELDDIVVPLQGVIKKAQLLFRPFFAQVAEAEFKAKEEMLLFQNKVKEKEVKLIEDFKSGKIKTVDTMLRKQGDLKVVSENSSTRTIRVLEIVNLNSIPSKYMIPDTAAITRDLKEGKKVSGCKLVNQTSIAI